MKIKSKIVVIQLFLLAITILPTTKVSAFISNGMNAQELLGQYDNQLNSSPQPFYFKGDPNDGPNIFSFEGPMEMDTVHHRFFLGNGARVLVYNLNTDNTFPDKIPDNILGQANLSGAATSITQSGLGNVSDIAYDSVNDRLFVSQQAAHRVSVFDVASITDGENATNVIGQSTFTASTAANTQAGLNIPQGLAYDSTNQRLFVMQQGNHRVTVFDVASITNGENAVAVLGQTNYTNSTASTSQARFNSPRGIAYDSTNQRLFVSQQSANRITVFDVASITNGENAVAVLGQTNYTNSSSATTQAGLNIPEGIDYDSSKGYLYVTQIGAHRVSIFDVNSITNGENAINVLGQPDFTSATAAISQAGMNNPFFALSDEGNELVYINQSTASRATVYDISTISNGEDAVDVFGQYDESLNGLYDKGGPNNGPNKWGFYGPTAVELDKIHHRLFVADSYNNRVLVHNLDSNNQFIDKVPDNVLGQTDFISGTAAISQTGMFSPIDLAYDPTHDRLFVLNSGDDLVENEYSRVLVFDTSSISDGMAASNVIGQPDFTSANYVVSQNGLSNAMAIAYDITNDRLFVGDHDASRITVYDTASISNGENAINVLGQTDFTTGTSATTQSGLRLVTGLAYDSTRQYLFVSDAGNNRVLVFDVNAITNGENAIHVLGQNGYTNNSSAVSQARVSFPAGLDYDESSQRLFLADENNQRVLVFDLEQINNTESAINVIGQSIYTTRSSATNQSGVDTVSNVLYDNTNNLLYLVDGSGTIFGGDGNNRVMVFDAEALPEIIASPTSVNVTEGGPDETFEVTLSRQPDLDIVVDIVSSSPTHATVSDSSLTFTNSNWNIPQTISVNAPQDINVTTEIVPVTLSINDSLSDPAWVSVTNTLINIFVADDDSQGFIISNIDNPQDITEEDSDSFQVVLSGEPDFNPEADFNDVYINIDSGDPGRATTDIDQLFFPWDEWDIPQTVNITTYDDTDSDDDQVDITLSIDTANSSSDFEDVPDQILSLNILDNESGGGGGGCTGSSPNEVCGSQEIQCPDLSNTFGTGSEAPANFQIGDDGARSISSTNDTVYSETLNSAYFDNDNDSNFDDITDDLSISSNIPYTCGDAGNLIQLSVAASNFVNGSSQGLLTYGSDNASGGSASATDYYAMLSVITSDLATCDSSCALANGSTEGNNEIKNGQNNFYSSSNNNDNALPGSFDNNSVLIDRDGNTNSVVLYNASQGLEGIVSIPGLDFALAMPANIEFSGAFTSTVTYTLNT